MMNRNLEKLTAMFKCAEINRRQFVKLSAAAGLVGVSQLSVLAVDKENTTERQLVMMGGFEWSKDVYERSVSSRCWWYTPYDDGWDGSQLSTDDDLKQIVEMEYRLGSVPEWAQRIVERSIQFLPPCGHYLFPQPFLEAVSAIGSQTPPTFVHSCFTVERKQKKRMMDYCLCLDAWLAGAPPEAAADELTALGYQKVDWHAVCTDVWEVLGEHAEWKDLLIERILHLLRNWIKITVWEDDPDTDFGRDQYLGNYSETDSPANLYCYINRTVPNFNERTSPKVKRLNARLAEICPGGLPPDLGEWWLCAPNAFRAIECYLWAIGKKEGLLSPSDKVPGFLQCQDTYPNQDKAVSWWKSFLTALEGWGRGQPESNNVADQVNQRLGEATPVKRWLARLLLRKFRLLEEVDELTRMGPFERGFGCKLGTMPFIQNS
jgi:hypothetical protein